MMNPFSDKKILLAAISGVIAGIVIASLASVPLAKANFLQDLLHNFVSPFLQSPTSTQSIPAQSVPTQLYQPTINYEQAVINAVKKASPAVVSITISEYVPIVEQCPYNPFSDLPPEFQQFFGNQTPQFYEPCSTGKKQLQQVGGGSGFIISSNGLILTNKHVVADTSASYTVFLNDGRSFQARVLARDPFQDLAIVKIDASDLPTAELGDSSSLQLGQTAIAIGNALGEFRNTVSVGVVSGLSRTIIASGPGVGEETIQGVIQTDAAINPGNSGGPLLDLQGNVIGINAAIASGANSIGFAIPINQAKHDIQSVETTGEIQVSYLGVRYLSLSPELAKAQNLSVDQGALLQKSSQGSAVEPGSPADKIGLRAGDIILKVNNQNIDQDHPLGDVISQFNVGDTITLEVNRSGKILIFQVTLEKRPNL